MGADAARVILYVALVVGAVVTLLVLAACATIAALRAGWNNWQRLRANDTADPAPAGRAVGRAAPVTYLTPAIGDCIPMDLADFYPMAEEIR
jgi:hypothetical protein